LQEIVGAVLQSLNGHDKLPLEVGQTLDLPDTIQAVILSRIDKLSEAEKLTLKIASVIGTSFQRLLLSKVHPMNDAQFLLASQLDRLEREKILRLEVPAPKWEYVFRNIIAQEVVYEGLLLSQRRQLHALVGDALEILTPSQIDRLAFHYSRSDNAAKAIHYLKAAGQKAQREYANQAAIGYYSRILEHLADPELGRQPISADYWDILFERTKLYNLTGQREKELEDLGTLGIMAEALNDNRRRALAAKQWVYLYETSGDQESGLELIERAVSLAEMAQDERLIGESYNHWGKLLYLRGEYQTAHDYLQKALLLAQKHKDRTAQADCLNNLSLVAHYQGDYDVAIYLFQEAIELWRATGNQVGLASSFCNLGQVYYDMGQYTTAQQRYSQALKLHRRIGDRAGEASAQLGLGKVQRSLGNYNEAYELIDAAFRFYHAIGDRHREAHCLSHLGFLYGRLQENETAVVFLEEAIQILRELKDPWMLAKSLAYYGWILHDLDQTHEAKKHVTEALKIERELNQEVSLMEVTALLGCLALTRNDLSLAETCLQHALQLIERQGVRGFEHPARVYLTGYHVLQRQGKLQPARKVLAEGYHYVTSLAAQIEAPDLQESYLTNIPEVQEICTLYKELELGGGL
jgi:adenylate cyclase